MTPQKEILLYQSSAGKCPFEEWIHSLRDRKAGHIVRTRLNRLAYGLAGKCQPVGQGIFELKIYYGPGYRVYFGQEGQTIVVIFCGGDKSTQRQDIEKAQCYWQDYKRRK